MRILAAVALVLAAGAAAADVPAKSLFGAKKAPSAQEAAPVGSYARGCLAGGAAAPETAPGWQMMRLSRNRNWGHPEAIAFLGRLSEKAQEIGWTRLLVGDISQPRGGPMLSGHRSHQIGLDIDVWMRVAPERIYSRAEREKVGTYSVVSADRRGVNGEWTEGHARVLQAAAEDPGVARIFVNAAIKAHLCETVTGDRDWLRRLRPWWGHDAHFHVRLRCPDGAAGCTPQDPPPPGPGCDASMEWWFSDEALNPKPSGKKRSPLTMAALPAACAAVLDAD